MFCPNCATEDQAQSQFCRACGIELNTVRTALQRPDAITASAISARDEIGRAIAGRIRELESADDLKEVAEDVLPKVEKFLEGPEQRRLRTAREGSITAAVVLAVFVFLLLLSDSMKSGSRDQFLVVLGSGAGLVTLLVGVAMMINAKWHIVVQKSVESSRVYSKQALPKGVTTDALNQDVLTTPAAGVSVTEGTTRQLR